MSGHADWDWGPWVKARVQHLGLKIGHVAYELGASRRTITRWLSRSDPPELAEQQWRKLAELLKVHPRRLAHVHKQNEPGEAGQIVFSHPEKRRLVPRVTKKGELVLEPSKELQHRYLCRDIGRISRGLSWHSLKLLWFYAVELGQSENLPAADIEYFNSLGEELDRE